MLKEHREKVVIEVKERVVSQKVREAQAGTGPAVEDIIKDTLYHERMRLDAKSPSKERNRSLKRLRKIGNRLHKASESDLKAILDQVVLDHVKEIVGNFDPRVYKFTANAVPVMLSFLLNALSPKVLLRNFPRLPTLHDNVVIQGETELLCRLDHLGTIILTPTHQTNLDSIVVGWVLHRLGLPPYTYGAGLNLFTNPILSFFMHNLGAYKVDRLKKHNLYKDVLKEYACYTIELGYDNIFFPGGTRSRSGELEKKLKMGLLGTGLTAFINNLKNNQPQPRVFVVPCTISYQLVLEAETLIEDFLKEAGKSRYIIEDDESSKPRRVIEFIGNLLALDAHVYFTVSRALDPFGNLVDQEGNSYDARGRVVDPVRYVLVDGEPDHLPQRDQQYTRELTSSITREFKRDNVVMSTHVTALAVYEDLRRDNPDMDLYRLLKTGGREGSLPLGKVYMTAEKVLAAVRELEAAGKIRFDPRQPRNDAVEVVTAALRQFSYYHTKRAVVRRGDRLYPEDPNLIFYYRNRLSGYGIEEKL